MQCVKALLVHDRQRKGNALFCQQIAIKDVGEDGNGKSRNQEQNASANITGDQASHHGSSLVYLPRFVSINEVESRPLLAATLMTNESFPQPSDQACMAGRKGRPADHSRKSYSQTSSNMKLAPISTSSYLYSDPIMLDEQPQLCHRHRKCLMKIAVSILFNIALAHHLIGRSTAARLFKASNEEESRNDLRRKCRNDLKRAVAFYTLSCRIHIFECIEMSEMMAMAHLNNLGQIHAILGNTRLSKAFFEKLLSNLALYNEYFRDTDNHETKEKRKRLVGFYRNAAQIILSDPMFAPAA